MWPLGLFSTINSGRGVLKESLWTSTDLWLLTDTQQSATQHRTNTSECDVLRGTTGANAIASVNRHSLSVSLCLYLWRCMRMSGLHLTLANVLNQIGLVWLLKRSALDQMRFIFIQSPDTQEPCYRSSGIWTHNLVAEIIGVSLSLERLLALMC